MPPRKINGYGYKESSLRVCIDTAKAGKIGGRVFSMRLAEPLEFNDISEFLLLMEGVMDEQNFPQSFQRKRQFKVKAGAEGDDKVLQAVTGTGMAEDTVNAAKGELATFTLRVLTRQNTSWQGHIFWDGQNTPMSFDSELELTQLMMAGLVSPV